MYFYDGDEVRVTCTLNEKSIPTLLDYIKRQNEEWIDSLFNGTGSITLRYGDREVTLVPKKGGSK